MKYDPKEVDELITFALDDDDNEARGTTTVEDIPWRDIGDFFDSPVNVDGTVIETIHDGRELDQPSSWLIVLSVVQQDGTLQYFGFRGYYDSWNGCEWEIEGVEELKRRERTIVEYV